MKKPLLLKLIAIGALMVLLLIPLALIGNSIEERQRYSEKVVGDIARSSSHSQTLTGPILVIPYRKLERITRLNEQQEKISEERQVSGELYFLPELLKVDSNLTTELRQLGIYRAHLYHSQNTLEGHFLLPPTLGISDDFGNYTFEPAYIAFGISDSRGIENLVTLKWNQSEITAEPGTGLKILTSGIHVAVGQVTPGQSYSFALELKLQGTSQFSLVPLGKETRLNLVSDWPHPSFTGNFLPTERRINQQGFEARWQTSDFSTNLHEKFLSCAGQEDCNAFWQTNLGVKLIDPINHYVKSVRAIKYAVLFIALTFAGFFLFEVLQRLQVHPIQYALVGLALAFFYLLLISLAEHIGFNLAYGVSTLACVSLIGFYVSYVLHSRLRALGFTIALTLLYALLYGLLSAEDYALLMGAILLFALLAAFMTLTRKVDWYSLNNQQLVEKL